MEIKLALGSRKSAFEGGSKGGRVHRVMRKVMKQAVRKKLNSSPHGRC